MSRPLPLFGTVKQNIEQQLLIAVSRSWAGWVSRAARLQRILRHNTVSTRLENLTGSIVSAVATGGVLLVGPILTRSDND